MQIRWDTQTEKAYQHDTVVFRDVDLLKNTGVKDVLSKQSSIS